MRNKFNEQLVQLNEELVSMGALCEEVITLASRALTEADNAVLLDQIVSIDREIDQEERTIENLCLKLILHQQPVAGDLRQISAALKMITDMERIGDQAEDIAEIIGYIGSDEKGTGVINDPELAKLMGDMASSATKMVTSSVDAYVKQDIVIAQQVIDDDDIVDGYFKEVKSHLVEMIVSGQDEGGEILDFLMISKYFERIADHAVNIAEWVIFSVTGERKGELEGD